MTDERTGTAMGQLEFFNFSSRERSRTGGRCPPDPLGFFALRLETARTCRAGRPQPDLPFTSLQSALGLRPRRALSSDGARQGYQPSIGRQAGLSKSPLLLARPLLLTTNCPLLLTTAVRFCSHRDSKPPNSEVEPKVKYRSRSAPHESRLPLPISICK